MKNTVGVTNGLQQCIIVMQYVWIRLCQLGFYLFWSVGFNILYYTGLYRWVWVPIYWLIDLVYGHTRRDLLVFMNWGYVPLNADEASSLAHIEARIESEPPIYHNSIRLYEKTMSLCPLYAGDAMRGKHLLEISCGHGGGLVWLGKTHAHLERIVEASHCYYVEANTWQSFARVLKPGGYLMWCDMRPTELEAWMWRSAEKSGLKLIACEEITDNVRTSCARTAEQRHKWIGAHPIFRHTSFIWANFWAAPGSAMHTNLVDRTWRYYAACWQKPVASVH